MGRAKSAGTHQTIEPACRPSCHAKEMRKETRGEVELLCPLGSLVGLPDKIQDSQLHFIFRLTTNNFECKYVPNITYLIILKSIHVYLKF